MAMQLVGTTPTPCDESAPHAPPVWHMGAGDVLPERAVEGFTPEQLVGFESVRASMQGRPRRNK